MTNIETQKRNREAREKMGQAYPSLYHRPGQSRYPSTEELSRAVEHRGNVQPCHHCGKPVQVESYNYAHVGGYDQDQVLCDIYIAGEDCRK